MKAVWTAMALLAAFATANATTLDDYLDAVRASHPLFAREAMQPEIDAAASDALRGREDWLVTSAPSFTHSEPPRSSPFEPERIDVLRLDGGLSRSYWGNGSRVSLSWDTEVTDQNLPGFSIPGPGGAIDVPIGPSTYYRHALRATYALPLMRNQDGVLDRLDHELSRFDIDVSRVRALENQEQFLLEVGVKYLDWALADERVRIAGERLLLAEEELERTRRKRRSYLVDEADVLRAEDAVYVARNGLLLAGSASNALRVELAALAGRSDAEQGSPEFDLYARPVAPTREEAERAVDDTRVIREIGIREAQLDVVEAGFLASGRPQLDVFVSGALLGGDDDLGGSLEMTHPDVTVGLEFRHPIGTRTADAEVRRARLQRRQLDFARRSARTNLAASARAVVARLDDLADVLEVNQERIESARRKTAEELALYNQGRGDITFVIQSRDSEAVAKLTYASNAAAYHQLLLQYRALVDRLMPVDD